MLRCLLVVRIHGDHKFQLLLRIREPPALGIESGEVVARSDIQRIERDRFLEEWYRLIATVERVEFNAPVVVRFGDGRKSLRRCPSTPRIWQSTSLRGRAPSILRW